MSCFSCEQGGSNRVRHRSSVKLCIDHLFFTMPIEARCFDTVAKCSPIYAAVFRTVVSCFDSTSALKTWSSSDIPRLVLEAKTSSIPFQPVSHCTLRRRFEVECICNSTSCLSCTMLEFELVEHNHLKIVLVHLFFNSVITSRLKIGERVKYSLKEEENYKILCKSWLEKAIPSEK